VAGLFRNRGGCVGSFGRLVLRGDLAPSGSGRLPPCPEIQSAGQPPESSLILAISLAVLIPGQSALVVRVELVVVVVLMTALVLAGAVQMLRRADRVPGGVWMRLSLAFSSSILALAAGVSLIVGSGPGRYLDVPAILFAVPASGWMAWQVIFPPETRLRTWPEDQPNFPGETAIASHQQL
jgi:hypothetical protein